MSTRHLRRQGATQLPLRPAPREHEAERAAAGGSKLWASRFRLTLAAIGARLRAWLLRVRRVSDRVQPSGPAWCDRPQAKLGPVTLSWGRYAPSVSEAVPRELRSTKPPRRG